MIRTFKCVKCEGEDVGLHLLEAHKLKCECMDCGHTWTEPTSDSCDYTRPVDLKRRPELYQLARMVMAIKNSDDLINWHCLLNRANELIAREEQERNQTPAKAEKE